MHAVPSSPRTAREADPFCRRPEARRDAREARRGAQSGRQARRRGAGAGPVGTAAASVPRSRRRGRIRSTPARCVLTGRTAPRAVARRLDPQRSRSRHRGPRHRGRRGRRAGDRARGRSPHPPAPFGRGAYRLAPGPGLVDRDQKLTAAARAMAEKETARRDRGGPPRGASPQGGPGCGVGHPRPAGRP